MKSLFSLLAIVISLHLPATRVGASDEVALAGAETGKWTMDFDAAVKLAGEQKLPLILNFTGSDWCHWCILMDKNVFADDSWKEYAKDKVVLVTLDFPKDKLKVPEAYQTRNNELKDRFKVRGYPSYVVLDSDGKTVLGQLGAGRDKTPEIFIKEFESTVRFSADNIEKYSTANPDKAEAYKEAISGFKKLEGDLKAWIATRPQRNEENNKIFADFQAQLKTAKEKLDSFK